MDQRQRRVERPELKEAHARASLAWADYWAEKVMTISLDRTGDIFIEEGKAVADHARIQRDKLITDNAKWLVGKYAPRTYGDKARNTAALSASETYRFRMLVENGSTRVRKAVRLRRLETVARQPEAPEEQERALQTLDLSWLLQDQPDVPASSASLQELYKVIQQSLRHSDYRFVDTLYRAAQVKQLPAETLVGMLRYAYSAHRKLDLWKPFLQEVRNELARRGMNKGKLLAGLVD
jgi:hypothetical protein